MANISVTNDLIKVKKGNVLYENEFDSGIVKEIIDLSNELVNSLIKLDFDWKNNDNLLVFNVVSKLVKFVSKFKKLNFDEKKNLANQVLNKIFEKIIKNRKLDDTISKLLIDGLDIVIEPSIDLALQTVEHKIELKDKCLKNCLKICKK
tara:strand:+ start:487 stop:933 length:447 start_codon:yes stop_codon:yes gene_type:complete